MLIRLLLLACLWSLAGAGVAAPRLLVVGDSLSAAFGMAAEQGWVALLQRRLAEHGHPFTVVNASISGDTTAGGLRRLPALLERHRPSIVIIALGGNDGLRGLPLDAIRANLDQMVALAGGAAESVLLVGVRMPPNYGPRYSEAFAAVFRDIAEGYGVPLVPALLTGVGERLDWMQADGIHPLPTVQPRLLDNVWVALEPLLAGT